MVASALQTGVIVGEIAIEITITVHTFFRFRARKVRRALEPLIKELLEEVQYSRVIYNEPTRLDSGRYGLNVTIEAVGSESRSHDLDTGVNVLLRKFSAAQKSVIATVHQRYFYVPVPASNLRTDEFAAVMLATSKPDEADLRPALVEILMRRGDSQPSE